MKGKVLVVDDDKAMCELIDTTLTMKGYSTTWCQSANEANALLHENDFDVVLTDVRMPGTTGLQLCQQVSSTPSRYPSHRHDSFWNARYGSGHDSQWCV